MFSEKDDLRPLPPRFLTGYQVALEPDRLLACKWLRLREEEGRMREERLR